MLVPPAVQLPLFVVLSMIFQTACIPPSPLEMESVFTFDSLTQPDSTATMPIVVGLLSLANVDTSKWLVGGKTAQNKLSKDELETQKQDKDGVIKIRPQQMVKGILRLLSVARILVAMSFPGVMLSFSIRHPLLHA